MDEYLRTTPYDDAFRTLTNDLPKITLLFINEMFREELEEPYTGREQVVQLVNEHFLRQQDGKSEKRITDSSLSVIDSRNKKKNYHMECQERDGSILIRVYEYDSQIALQNSERTEEKLVVNFPHSGILVLRSTRNTPEQLGLTINTPGGSVSYMVPVVKLKDYDVEQIIDKQLFFLIPFYLFKYESLISAEKTGKNRQKAVSGRLVSDYKKLRQFLEDSCDRKVINEYEKRSIEDITRSITESLANGAEETKKEVKQIMCGQILEYEAKTILNQGRAEGGNAMLYELVQDGELKIETAAKKANVSVDAFVKNMMIAGYNVPR